MLMYVFDISNQSDIIVSFYYNIYKVSSRYTIKTSTDWPPDRSVGNKMAYNVNKR